VNKRPFRAAVAAACLLALAAGPGSPSPTHVMALDIAQCVVLAANGGEEDVTLPMAVFAHNPNVDIAPTADRLHPLHVLFHQGVPREHMSIAVAGTAAAGALCANGIVND
jgi:hypothetical protein